MGNHAEANLSALIESTEDHIWSVDLNYALTLFNRAFHRHIEQIYGVQAAVGMHPVDLFLPERAAIWPQLFKRALTEGPFRIEHPLLDGHTLEMAFNPIIADGKATGISVFGKDITERKRIEEALRESVDSLKEAESIGDLGGYILDVPTEVWTSSAVLDGIFGIDKEYDHTVAGWTALIHPDDRAMMAAYFADEVVGLGKTFDKEYRIVRQSDQAERWVHGMGRLDSDAHGRPLKMRGVIKDITGRKLSEIQLRESEERYRLTFEQAAVGIVHTSFEGCFLRCNPRFAEIVGYLQEEIPGMAFRQITLPEDMPESEAIRQRIANGETGASTWEKRYLRKDGSLTWVRMTVSAQRDGSGRALHSIALVEDINDRKTAEERLTAVQEALRASEERYHTAFETSVDGMAITHLNDGRYLDVNRAFLNLMGFDREEVIGRTSLEIKFWTEPEVRRKLVDELRQNSNFQNAETQFIRKDGARLWLLVSGSTIEIDGVPCILSVVRDISTAKEAEQRLAAAAEALRATEERYRTVFQTSPDLVTINRLSDGAYIDANQAFFDAMGFEINEVMGRTSLELKVWADPRDEQNLAEILRQNSNCRNFEARLRKKNGEMFLCLMSASVMELDGVSCILCMTRDISEAKAAEDKIRNLAFYDSLTGLPNRRLLMERLRQTLASSPRNLRKQALLLVGMDNFKTLNETLGHQTGDLLLQTAARRLSACLGEDGPAARLSGDEFLVVLEDLGGTTEEAAAKARAMAERILAAISPPYLLAGRAVRSTASIGITFFGDRLITANEILQQADIALEQAKTAGRNTMRFFAPALQAAVNARAALEDDLRQAIKSNQFVLYYQPQVDRNRLIGAEALIRWNHPTRGLLAPGEFIPLAEETGLILPLGDWVLETACAQIAAFSEKAATSHIAIAVNISARQFRQPDFDRLVLAAIDRTGANPRNLELELTESMLVENIEDVIAKMTELKSHGLRFSLDDFGTGYSSLAYLKRLPLDLLKIDRSSVRDILVDASSGAIAQTILSLSSAMGLPVIAEGVETEEQRDFLAGLGCHSFQGYLFSRPMPLEEFERLWLNSAKSAAPILQ
jgi:diguanylate cyclase (GGDEF)-like protein/PAS domain S-box-containing protein